MKAEKHWSHKLTARELRHLLETTESAVLGSFRRNVRHTQKCG